jgi:hypothetical protein
MLPDLFTEPDVASLGEVVLLTAVGLILHADNYGRGTANPVLALRSVLPYSEVLSPKNMSEMLAMLEDAEFLILYEVEGRPFYEITARWWVPVSHPGKPQVPPPARAGVSASSSARPQVWSEPPRLSSGSLPETFPAGEGEREGARAGAGESASESGRPSGALPEDELDEALLEMDRPPTDFCPDHPLGVFEDCGPCGLARRRRERWEILHGFRRPKRRRFR